MRGAPFQSWAEPAKPGKPVLPGAEVIAALTPKRNKYRVAPKADRTWEGVVYASKAEMQYAQGLELQKKAGRIREWSRQYSLPLMIGNVKVGTCVVDFRVLGMDGSLKYIEVKGRENEVYRFKKRVLFACMPGIEQVYEVVRV